MALGCRYVLASSQRAHLLHLDGDPWQNSSEQLWGEEGGGFLLGHSAGRRRPAQERGSVSGPGRETKGTGAWPVRLAEEVRGHRAFKSSDGNVRACTSELHAEGGGINNEAEAQRNKLSVRLIYGPQP